MTSTGSWGPNRVPSSMAQTLTGSPSSRPAASSMPARIPKSQSACGKLLSLTSAFTRLRIPREFRIWTVRAKYTSETWPALISGSLATWKARLGWLVIRAREPRGLPEVPAIVPETGGEVNRTKARSGPQTAVRQGISGVPWGSGFDSRGTDEPAASLDPRWDPARPESAGRRAPMRFPGRRRRAAPRSTLTPTGSSVSRQIQTLVSARHLRGASRRLPEGSAATRRGALPLTVGTRPARHIAHVQARVGVSLNYNVEGAHR